MATPVVMPQMGYDMKEGTIVRWLKREGEQVQRGEAIAEIETDKAVVSMEAYTAGVLRKIVVPEGKVAPVGEVIAVIGGKDEPIPPVEQLKPGAAPPAEARAPAEAPKAEERPAPPREEAQAPAAAEAAPEAREARPREEAPPAEVRATPIARRLAREKGIDLRQVKGTGPGGRVTEEDVLAAEEALRKAPARAEAPPVAVEAPPLPAAAPEAVPAEREELSRMRQAIARTTIQSKQQVPHFYVTAEVDMTAAVELRRQLNEALQGEDVRISVNDLIIKAVALAVRKFPHFNAFYRGEYLQVNREVNVGVAIALEAGLIVPAVLRCEGKSLVEIARASRDLVQRAQKGALRQEEFTGATISTSNLGMYDVDSFAAIIHPPQACVLAVGAVRERPVVRDHQVVARQTMFATVSVDHRVADGAEAARFLSEVKRLLEHPMLLLV